jgi:hypothetical protein
MLPFVDHVTRLILALDTVSVLGVALKSTRAIVAVPTSATRMIEGPFTEFMISD